MKITFGCGFATHFRIGLHVGLAISLKLVYDYQLLYRFAIEFETI